MEVTKIVHICSTSISGSPAGIVKALNRYSKYSAELVNLGVDLSSPFFKKEEQDKMNNKVKITSAIESTDIIHLHQVVPFKLPEIGINLADKKLKNKVIIRQWHSEPGHYSRWGLPDVDKFLNEKIPHLVLSQYHERYYPWASNVPNLIDTERLVNIKTSWPIKPTVVFSPSNRFRADERRWASKGFSELVQVLEPLIKDNLINLEVLENIPNEEVLKRKAKATFVIDEVVTGSYHRSGLEGLALGKPTFAYLDHRTSSSLALLTGTINSPFLNCRLKELPKIILHLLENPRLIQSIGNYSRQWMSKYYTDEIMVKKYTDIYDRLLKGDSIEASPKGFPVGGELFLKSGLIDLLH